MKSWIFCGRRLDPRARGASGEPPVPVPDRRRRDPPRDRRRDSDVILRRVIRENVRIPLDDVALDGVLSVPDEPAGIVLFANGSSGGRSSSANQLIARHLQDAGVGTLLIDLLTPEEDLQECPRFNIRLLAARLDGVAAWLRGRAGGPEPRFGYFGASTGAAAAFLSASGDPSIVAIVTGDGRPDLCAAVLSEVRARSLLIVGETDVQGTALNRDACDLLQAPCRMATIPGADSVLDEGEALEETARLAADWFREHLPPRRTP